MSKKKVGNSEVYSPVLFMHGFSQSIRGDSPPPVQASKDSPADPAGSVASLSLRDNSPVPVEVGSTEWVNRWREEFKSYTGLKGPSLGSVFLAGDERWTLWHVRTPVREAKGKMGKWKSIKIYFTAPKRTVLKRSWYFGWHSEKHRVSSTEDTKKLEKWHPEILEWAVNVLKSGQRIRPPASTVKTFAEHWRENARKAAKTRKARRQEYERKRYEARKAEKQARLQNIVMPSEDRENMLEMIQSAWEAKRPYSIWPQTKAYKRHAPTALAEVCPYPEEIIEAWLKSLITAGLIAEEMVSTKTKLRGLKVLRK